MIPAFRYISNTGPLVRSSHCGEPHAPVPVLEGRNLKLRRRQFGARRHLALRREQEAADDGEHSDALNEAVDDLMAKSKDSAVMSWRGARLFLSSLIDREFADCNVFANSFRE
jgi:hypothetical protein